VCWRRRERADIFRKGRFERATQHGHGELHEREEQLAAQVGFGLDLVDVAVHCFKIDAIGRAGTAQEIQPPLPAVGDSFEIAFAGR
jgi:hypothetical protein